MKNRMSGRICRVDVTANDMTPSYNGVMSFAVTSTREILPDIRFFIECLEASMAELKEAAKAVP